MSTFNEEMEELKKACQTLVDAVTIQLRASGIGRRLEPLFARWKARRGKDRS